MGKHRMDSGGERRWGGPSLLTYEYAVGMDEERGRAGQGEELAHLAGIATRDADGTLHGQLPD